METISRSGIGLQDKKDSSLAGTAIAAGVVRSDKKGKGIPCGKGWISPEKECRVKGSGGRRSLKQKQPNPQQLKFDQEIARNAGFVTLGTAIGLGITGGAIALNRSRSGNSRAGNSSTNNAITNVGTKSSFLPKSLRKTKGLLGRGERLLGRGERLLGRAEQLLDKEKKAVTPKKPRKLNPGGFFQKGNRSSERELRTFRELDKSRLSFAKAKNSQGKIVGELSSSGSRSQKSWTPTMSTQEAEEWSKDAAYPDTVYHATGLEGEQGIKKTGFVLSRTGIGRVYGDGVYVTLDKQDAEYYRSKTPLGTILPLKTNAAKIFDVDAVIQHAKANNIDLNTAVPTSTKNKPELKAMRLASVAMGKEGEYQLAVDSFRKQLNTKTTRFGSPESRAFEKILRDEGYEGVKLTGASFGKPLMVIFDPKNLTVIGDQKEDYEFSKKRKRPKGYEPDINGVKLKSTPFPDFTRIPDVPLQEPPFPSGVSGKHRKSGITVIEPDGRVWLMKNKGAYGGEHHSNPRGGAEKGLTDQQNAIKEAKEELGLDVKIIGYLGDFDHHKGNRVKDGDDYKAVTRQYIGVRTGGSPWDAGWETESVKLSTLQSAKELVSQNRKLDQSEIFKSFEDYWSQDSNRSKIKGYFLGYRGDAKGVPCGKGWISPEKECQISSSGSRTRARGKSRQSISGQGLKIGLIMGGVVAGSATAAAAYYVLDKKSNKSSTFDHRKKKGIPLDNRKKNPEKNKRNPNNIPVSKLSKDEIRGIVNKKSIPDSELSLVDQRRANGIVLDKSKPKIKDGITSNTYFVKDARDREYIMKEVVREKNLLEGSADVTVAEMGLKAGVKVNEVAMIPASVDHPLKRGDYGATLHSLVPGKPTNDLPSSHKYSRLTLYQRDKSKNPTGLKRKHIKTMSKHPDLAKIAALDTFTGNWDRHSRNIFYDEAKDSFWGIDMGSTYSHKRNESDNTDSLSKQTMTNLKKVDFRKLSQQERQGLKTYLDTLKTLHKDNPPEQVERHWMSYIRKEKGDDDLLKRYKGVVSIEDNYQTSGELIKYLERQLSRTDSLLDEDYFSNSRIGIHLAVKDAIASVYGVFDDFPVVRTSRNGDISGVFFDRGQLYDYEISPVGELSYVESAHSDSYLIGFSVDSGRLRQLRGDRTSQIKKKNGKA